MTREELFLKLNKEAEVLLENGFALVTDYSEVRLSAKVYEKHVGSKHFVVSVSREGAFFMVKTRLDTLNTNGLGLENKIKFTLDSYPSVESKIKEAIKVISDLSNGLL